MEKRKTFIIIIIVLMMLIGVALVILKVLDGNVYGLKKTGNFYDNMSDFSILSEENPDDLTQTYLESVAYEITGIDKEKMTATIELQIPKISDELSEVLDKVISENKDAGYDELKTLAEKELANVLKSMELDKKTETITLSIEKAGYSYRIIPSPEWNSLITGSLEELYVEYLKALIGGMTDEMPQ